MPLIRAFLATLCVLAVVMPLRPNSASAAQASDADSLAFFEKKIRPVLVEHCYACHSSQSKKLEGSLSLETRDLTRKGGDQGPAVVPGDIEKSLLIRAIRYTDTDLQMPPEAQSRLSPEVVADFETWIKNGATDPREGTPAAAASKYVVDIEAAKEKWPFSPPADPPVPQVTNQSWPRNAIDRFLLARLEARGLAPTPDADPRTLIRRVTYDLTGLPPSPADIEELAGLFPTAGAATDDHQQHDWQTAFQAYVDRLLASPTYGERWGRHWLDVVRYADTAGDNSDYPIPQLYKYRNWVIQALNDDLPFDDFIRQQIAGDLLPAETTEQQHSQVIATGYLASARRFGSRVSDYPQHLTIEDTIDNLGRAFLGMSLSCARCHNHKFDPFTNDDYYALYGIFHSTRYPWPGIELEKKQRDLVPLVPADVVKAATAHRQQKLALLAPVVKANDEAKKASDQLVNALQSALAALQAQSASGEEVGAVEKELTAAKEQAERLDKQLKAARKKKADVENMALPYETAYAVAEAKKIEDCKVQLKGDPERTGPLATRHLPIVFGGQQLKRPQTSGRLELAAWIASPDNPLTARVLVNRLWHHHFGRGIVATPNDFGRQGKPPTNPELLDFLARRFIESGWSLKAMHRLLVTSRAYQMASDDGSISTAEGSPVPGKLKLATGTLNPREIDPANELLWHFNRRRLDAESIRDTLLVLGGNLDPTPGEAHPFPPQQDWDFTQHKPFKAVYETNRRSVYLMTQRIQRHPLMAIFDGPDTGASTGSRPTSTTTLQALYFLNDPFVHQQAERLAARLKLVEATDAQRIKLAYNLCFGRSPSDEELALCQEFLRSNPSDASREEAWSSLLRSLLRTNEFVYLN